VEGFYGGRWRSPENAEEVRSAAALSLATLARPDQPENVAALLKLLEWEYDRPTRRYVLVALGRSGSPDACKALAGVLREGSGDEPAWAAIALGILRDSAASPQLRKALRDAANPSMRAAACVALGLLHDAESVPALRAALRDRDDWLPGYAALSLALLQDRESLPAIRIALGRTKDPDVRRNIAIALGLFSDAYAVTELLSQFQGRSALDDRSSAAMALGVLRATKATPALVAAALDEREPDVLRASAVAALGQIADPDPQPRLTRFLRGLDSIRELPAVWKLAHYVRRR
jgi:HEAT repeat protein